MPSDWQSDTTNQRFLSIFAIRGECWRREQGIERNRSAKICYREIGSRLRVCRQRHGMEPLIKCGDIVLRYRGRAVPRHGDYGVYVIKDGYHIRRYYNKHGHRKLLSMEIDRAGKDGKIGRSVSVCRQGGRGNTHGRPGRWLDTQKKPPTQTGRTA